MSEGSGVQVADFLPSLWVSANAGSGKTSILVGRVVGLLLRGVAPERICCITYTKAAAGEMRGRIVKTLRELLVLDDASCRAKVADILGRAASDAEVVRARGLFAQVLDSAYGGVQLTTIHGFCQRLLKQFPLEAGVAPLFSVLEDAERDVLKRMARLRLYNVQQENVLSEALALLVARSGEVRIGAILDTVDAQADAWARVLEYTSLERLRTQIYAQHKVLPDCTADTLRADFCDSLLSASERDSLRAALPEFLNHQNKTEQKLGAIFGQWLELNDVASLEAVVDHFVTNDGRPSSRAFGKSAPLIELLARMREQCAQYRQRIAALACAEESVAMAMVAEAYRRIVQQLKFDRGVLDYQDLVDRAGELLTSRVMIGWVMRKLDHRIDHLLIDEAQDTSPNQWRIARALVDELIAMNDGVGSGNVPRSLLVVGDEKQSIFSFQGASPKHFSTQEIEFQQLLSTGASPLERKSLRVSYRSAQAVLRVVDAVAALPYVAVALSEALVEEHRPHRADAPGSVTLHPLLIAEEKPAFVPFSIPKEYVEAQSASQLLAEKIATDVTQWIAEKHVVAGDILILVHRRKPMAPALIRALEKNGVPVSGMDRLVLSQHLAVRDLLALMAWCVSPGDDLALAHVLRSPIIGMSDEVLRAIAVHRAGSLWEVVRATSHAPLLLSMQEVATLPPYEFLTQVLEVLGARRRFAERFGEEVHEILDELKAQAARIPAGMVPSIAWFHDWMVRSERVVKREQEGNTGHVRIMTVHGAKGLEAPIVILADTVNVPDLRKEVVYFSEADGPMLPLVALSDEAKLAPAFEAAKAVKKLALQQEYQRLLYVALTRARDELHIYGALNKQRKSEHIESTAITCWYDTVKAAMHSLPEVVTLADGALQLRNAGTAKPSTHSVITPQIVLPEWARRVPEMPKPSIHPLAPSRLGAGVQGYTSSGVEDAAARGVRIHRVLEWLRAESSAEEISSLVRVVAPEWDEVVQAAVSEEIRLLHVKHRWLWEHPGQAEVSVTGSIMIGGAVQPILGQIDRLVMMPDAVVIVDFKTGKSVPKDVSEVPENYALQLRAYRDVLAQIYRDKPIRMALVYTALAEVVWVE